MLKSLSYTGHHLLYFIVSSVFHDLCILGVIYKIDIELDIKSQHYEQQK